MKTQATILLLVLALLSLSSCDGGNKQEAEKTVKKTIVKKPKRGDVRDAHGCLISEGYVWSAAKDSCIHLWESGTELTATDRSEHVVFVVVSNDKMKAEIFIPEDTSFIMYGSNGTYTNDSLVLTETGKDYTLRKGGKTIYQTAPIEPVQEVKKTVKRKRRR